MLLHFRTTALRPMLAGVAMSQGRGVRDDNITVVGDSCPKRMSGGVLVLECPIPTPSVGRKR